MFPQRIAPVQSLRVPTSTRGPLDFSTILPPNPPPRPPLDFSTILHSIPRAPPPLPRVPIVVPLPPPVPPNQYTGITQRGCDGSHIHTQHRYPTRHSRLQTGLVNLVIQSKDQSQASSKYSTAANIIASQDSTHTINSVLDPTTGSSLEYIHLMKGPTATTCQTSFANKLGFLENGVGIRMTAGTNTLGCIPRSMVPKRKTVTYGCLV